MWFIMNYFKTTEKKQKNVLKYIVVNDFYSIHNF